MYPIFFLTPKYYTAVLHIIDHTTIFLIKIIFPKKLGPLISAKPQDAKVIAGN